MNKSGLSLILSIIGAFTGISGLVLHFYKHYSESVKIKVECSEDRSYFFNKLKEYNSYRTNNQAITYIHIVNKSALPLTLYKVDAFCNHQKIPIKTYEGSKIELSVNENNMNTVKRLLIKEQLKLPLRLEPYDAYNCYIFFPFFVDSSKNSEIIKLTLKTSRKNIKCKVLLSKTYTQYEKV